VCVDAEREFISELGLGCHAPVAALASLEEGMVRLHGLAAGETGMARKSVAAPRESILEAARGLARDILASLEI
jgi:porphobilinogen deaminase